VQIDELWPGGPRFIQREPVFKLGTDAVLLAHFTNTARMTRGVDLGCGAGILPVLLTARSPELAMDCVDILPEAVALTAENAALNGLTEVIGPLEADIRGLKGLLQAGAYDLVVSNPPYFPVGGGKRAAGNLADARDEALCTLDALCGAAGYLLRWGGRCSIVHRPERLAELFAAMQSAGIEPKRLRPVTLTAGAKPSLILVEGKRGANPGLVFEPSLILQDAAGNESEELRQIYHRDN